MICREPARRRRLARTVAAVALLLAAPALAAGVVSRPESQLLLLQLEVDRTLLDVTLTAYRDSGRVWVPLQQLAGALDLAIEVDLARQRATGFVLAPDRPFDLDLAAGEIRIGRTREPIPAGAVEVHADDLYADLRALSSWLPLDLEVDERNALLVIRPREPLPAARREQRRGRAPVTIAAAVPPEPETPARAAPYRALGWPVSDHLARISRQPASFGDAAWLQYSVAASGDLLWMEARGRASVDDRHGFGDQVLTLRREAPRPTLLGPLRARVIEVGDLFDPGLDPFSLPRSGRGLLLSSFPAQGASEFGRESFQGDLPPGWDAELFRNDELVAYQGAGSGGAYRFTDVPVLSGINQFRVALHGPQGQSRSETRTLNLGAPLTPVGKASYRLLAYRPHDGPTRARTEVDVGLASRLSAGVRVLTPDADRAVRPFTALGLRWTPGPWFVRADAALDSARGRMVQGAAATRLAGVGLWAGLAQLAAYQSEVFRPAYGPIRTRATLRLDGDPGGRTGTRAPMSLEWRADRLAAGGSSQSLTQVVSTVIRRLGLSHRFTRTWVDAPSAPATENRGALLASGGGRGLMLRGELDYAPGGSRDLDALSLAVETWALGGCLLQAGVQQGLGERAAAGHLALVRNAGRFGVHVRSDYAERGGASASLLIAFSLARDPRGGDWTTSARPEASWGSASASVFLDEDGDGVRDAGERPLIDVTVRADPPGVTATTGPDGRARLGALPGGVPVRLTIVESSLGDPLWIAESTEVAVRVRPGVSALADLPVMAAGEISGTVSILRGGAPWPAIALPIELAEAASGKVVRQALTAYDGFYDLPGLKAGRYVLRVASASAARLRLAAPERAIEVPPRGALIEGVDLLLTPLVPAAARDEDRP